MSDTAFLSVRVPEETKRLIKEIAATKGTTIQRLVRQLVDDLIEKESNKQPSLAEIITKIRSEKNRLQKYNVAHVDLFGSVVKNNANENSDIDIAVEFKPGKPRSLSQFASLQEEFHTLLGRKVDLSERRRLKPEVKRELTRDAIRVF